MKYTKPALDFHQQALLLISRGLIANVDELTTFLSTTNYYRFSGYLYPYRYDGTDKFIPGTTLDHIRTICEFDSELRLLILSFVEIIEIAILRTRLVEQFSLSHGPFCYVNYSNYHPNFPQYKHDNLLKQVEKNVQRSNHLFVELYKAKYKEETHLPFWMVAEISSFSQLSIAYQYAPVSVARSIATEFNLHPLVLSSWLHTLSVSRNFCAHFARIWNRTLPVKPKMPSKKHLPEFYTPSTINNSKFAIVFAIINHLLMYLGKQGQFSKALENLLNDYPGIPIGNMGLPENWKEYPIFK